LKLVWLSHILEASTPLYGGSANIEIIPERQITSGDSCNTSILKISSHAGTHVDAPYHFIAEGSTVDKYSPESWVFNYPQVLDVPLQNGQLIAPQSLPTDQSKNNNVDLVLIRTGFEQYRSDAIYWKDGPGLSHLLAAYLKSVFPCIRAIGIDFISVSSLRYREEGHAAHKAFLESGMLLFEDMSLRDINNSSKLNHVIALPVRFALGDGAPCTIIGWLED
jgi:kynurenine formamidase